MAYLKPMPSLSKNSSGTISLVAERESNSPKVDGRNGTTVGGGGVDKTLTCVLRGLM